MSKPCIPTNADRQEAVKDLEYELEMLHQTAFEIEKADNPSQVCHNALVESFAIHARNLIEFFYENRKNPRFRAVDLFSCQSIWRGKRGTMPDALGRAREMANERISHLTYGRVRLAEGGKVWECSRIVQALQQTYKEFREALSEDADAAAQLPHLHGFRPPHPNLCAKTCPNTDTTAVTDPAVSRTTYVNPRGEE